MNLGIYPNYNEVNIIILQILNYSDVNIGSKLIKQEFKYFLIEYIKRNGKLDSFQKKLLNDSNVDLNFNVSNDELLCLLGNEFNIDEYKIKDLDYIKKKYIGNRKNLKCDQRLQLINSVSDEDLDMFKYDNVILTSDNYEDVLNSGKCPYKDGGLSNEILDQISIRRSLLKRLGYKVNKVKNVNIISDDYFVKLELAFIELIKLNCNKDVTTFSLNTVQKILISLGINIDLMNLLPVEHYKRTFYISCYEKLKSNFDETIKHF